jgi:hypothetical protein
VFRFADDQSDNSGAVKKISEFFYYLSSFYLLFISALSADINVIPGYCDQPARGFL